MAALKWLIRSIWVGGMIGLCAIGVDALIWTLPPSQGDFISYLAAAAALRMNPSANIFDTHVIGPLACAPFTNHVFPYIYPPLLAILFEPLTYFPCHDMVLTWELFNLGLWVVIAIWILRDLPHRMLLFPLALFFFPMWTSFYTGQINEVILLGLLAVVALMERDKPRWAGMILGLITIIKVYPGLLLVYVVLRRKWSMGLSALLTIGGTVLIMGLVVGWAGLLRWGVALTQFHLYSDHAVQNLSLWRTPLWPLLIVLTVCYLVAVARYRDGDLRLGYAWGICLMLLVLPLIWEHYFVWLLPVFVYHLLSHPARPVIFVLALLYLMTALPIIPFNPVLTILVVLPLYGISGWRFLVSSPLLRSEFHDFIGLASHRAHDLRKKLAVLLSTS